MVAKGKTPVQRTMRVGEGVVVDVEIVPATKGEVVHHYSIDTSGLPVPDRRLSCDTVSLMRTDFVVKLMFAQKETVGGGYLSVLVVQMTFDAIKNFLRTSERFEKGVEELEKSGKLQRGELIEITERPSQTAVVSASLVLAGYSGYDGCLDFYYTSPFAIQRINFGNKMPVEPVVRVQLPTPLLIAMSRGLRTLAPSLPSLADEVAL